MATEYTYTLNEFLKDQLPELPGVIRSVALRELRLTLREFFDKSWAWTKEVQDVAIPTGVEGIQVDDSDENTDDPTGPPSDQRGDCGSPIQLVRHVKPG